MASAAVILLFVWYQVAQNGRGFDFSRALMAFAGYWYAPYLFIIGFLLVVYGHNRNALNLQAGERFVQRSEQPALYNMLEALCISRGLAVPSLIIRDHDSCNSYSWGFMPQTYKLVVTSGLLDKLKADELETVLAHELTHILTGDTRLLFLTGTLSNVFRTLGRIFWPSRDELRELTASRADSTVLPGQATGAEYVVFKLLLGGVWKVANLGALFVACFVSRKRVYIADASAVELTKNPQALCEALKKAGANMHGFYYEHDIKPALFHYQNGRETAGHPSISQRIEAVRVYSGMEPGERGAAGRRH